MSDWTRKPAPPPTQAQWDALDTADFVRAVDALSQLGPMSCCGKRPDVGYNPAGDEYIRCDNCERFVYGEHTRSAVWCWNHEALENAWA